MTREELDRDIVSRMARRLVEVKSPLGDTWGARFEAKNDLLDAGFSLPAVMRLFDRAKEQAGRIPA